MEFFDVVEARRSIHVFKKKAVEEEKLRKILAAANAAPSAHNLQSYEIVLIKSEEQKIRVAEAAYGQNFIATAPLVLVVLANPKLSAKGDERGAFYCILDATIAAAYIQLAAADLGLGTVWISAFDDDAVREVVDASKEMRPVAIFPIGYAAEKPSATPRRKIEDLAHEEKV